jgi:hypothetical protein
MNHEKNVTIRMKIPDSMKIHHIQVLYDQEHHILSIHEHHGHSENTVPAANPDNKDSSDGTSSSSTSTSSSTNNSHVEFTQFFPPWIQTWWIWITSWHNCMTMVLLPSRCRNSMFLPIEKHHHIRSIPVWTAAEAPAGGTTITASSHEPVLAQQ